MNWLSDTASTVSPISCHFPALTPLNVSLCQQEKFQTYTGIHSYSEFGTYIPPLKNTTVKPNFLFLFFRIQTLRPFYQHKSYIIQIQIKWQFLLISSLFPSPLSQMILLLIPVAHFDGLLVTLQGLEMYWVWTHYMPNWKKKSSVM